MLRLCSLILLCLSAAVQAGTIKGSAADTSGKALHEGTAQILELNRATNVDKEGNFTFDEVPAGNWTVKVISSEYGTRLTAVEVAEGQTAEVSFEFDLTVHENLVISAAPGVRTISDVAVAVDVLNEEELLLNMGPSLGETLANEPGISSTFFGAASSRPIIRGLSGERIRVLEGGLGTGDVSSVSVDHAVAIDTGTAQRVEILRGPASLRYGASAVGGVVNVLDNRIPEALPSYGLAGQVDLRSNTGSDEEAFTASLNGGAGSIAWNVDFSSVETDDFEIPEAAEIEEEDEDHEEGEEDGHEEEEEFMGVLENSGMDMTKGSAGLSFVTDRGFIGVSVSQYDNLYGVPGHGEHGHGGHEEDDHEDDHEGEDHDEEEGEEEEFVNIDLAQERYDLRGMYRMDGAINSLNFRLGFNDYEHTELEGDEIGTVFFNEYTEFRTEATHSEWGFFTSGSVGAQYSTRDFEAIGAEAFVPPNKTDRLSFFTFQERQTNEWTFTVGARYDNQTNQATALPAHHHEEEEHEEEEGEHHEEEEEEEPIDYDLNFNGFSTSVGFLYGRHLDYSISANLTLTERAPNAEELFSNGPHLATSAFEVGDPDLDKERSTGFDVVMRRKVGVFTGEINLFYNTFSDYIYEQFTGEEEDGLDEYEYIQGDATFQGAELHADVLLMDNEPNQWFAEFSYDFVRADLDDGGNLPRITPNRFRAKLEYKSPHLRANLGVQLVEDQKNVAIFETATEGYTLLDANISYRFTLGDTAHIILLRGNNLTDETARRHSSFLKNRTLLPGRNVSFNWRMNF